MKKILILLAFFSPLALNAYYGDIQNFIIEGNSICLNAPEVASKSYISQESSVSNNATWQAEITLSFSPTSSNYLKWFIMADSSNVNTSSNAYYLMFGGTKRTISFYHLKNGKSTLLYQEKEKLLDNSRNELDVIISRTDLDKWQIQYVLNDTLSGVCNIIHNQINYSSYFGWHCVYTKTRSKGFCFTNVSIKGEESERPRIPKFGDLLVNEILFNPIGDGVDFIEIINVSDTIFDLVNCKIGNKKQTYSLPSYLLLPDSVVVITKDTLILCEQYDCLFPKNILQVEKMLPLPNDSGCIRILSDTVLVDSVFYKSSMHHALLDNVEGISLQRTSGHSWSSSSSTIKATPGFEIVNIHNDEVDDIISSEDEDVFELLSNSVHIYNVEDPEKMVLVYRLHEPMRCSVRVFSLNGYPVFTILESQLLSGEGKLFWDGRGADLHVLPVGMYIILLEFCTKDNDYYVKKLPIALVP